MREKNEDDMKVGKYNCSLYIDVYVYIIFKSILIFIIIV